MENNQSNQTRHAFSDTWDVHNVQAVAADEDFVDAPVAAQETETPVMVRRFDPMTGEPLMPAQQKPAEQQEEQPVARKTKKNKSGGWRAVVAILLAVAIAAGSGVVTAFFVSRYWNTQFDLQMQALENKFQVLKEETNTGVGVGESVNPQVPAEEGLTPSQIYANNVGAVVAVANEGVQTNIFGQQSQTASSGSGFIISADGYVVSNYHVVEGAQKLTVITYDGTEHEAELVGYDSANDVSLMKIKAENLPHVTLGSSDELVVGDQVFAIGNPLGELTSTLTVGYVSAKERMVTTEVGSISMIQTDAAINSGNSGGPLFNTKGEVVGITTAKYSGTSGSGASIEGIGFAIPIDDVNGIINDLKEFGYVTSAYIGVSVRDVDSYGVGYGLPAGAFIEEIVKGAAAEKAGLQVWDIIVELGGHEVSCVNDLLLALRKMDAGETTTVTVYRTGQRMTLNITLEEKPQQ